MDGKGSEYHLTPAGEELGPLIAQIGLWSERWLRRPIFEETPDTGLLMWWMRGTIKADALPAGRTVIHFRFRGAPEKLRYFWLVLPEADLCLSDPGFGVDITVRSDPKTLIAVWVGDLPLGAALSSRTIELEAPDHLVRSFPNGSGCTRCTRTSSGPPAGRDSPTPSEQAELPGCAVAMRELDTDAHASPARPERALSAPPRRRLPFHGGATVWARRSVTWSLSRRRGLRLEAVNDKARERVQYERKPAPGQGGPGTVFPSW